MSSPKNSDVRQSGSREVHPIFHHSKFPANIDYETAFYEAVVLATRLMNSPQALQHDYCFYFGKSVSAMKPGKQKPGTYGLPAQYACDKGIGELDEADIRAVQEQRIFLANHVRYNITDEKDRVLACCNPGVYKTEGGGIESTVGISSAMYQACLTRHSDPEIAALAILRTATVLLHELAHAAHHYLYGPYEIEDFRENSNICEAGFEYECRLFGTVARIDLKNRAYWETWQSREWMKDGYDLDTHTRRTWQIPKSYESYAIDKDFLLKLCDDGFWQGEYLQRGAQALIPDHIVEICRSDTRCITYKSIPLSILDLFRKGGPSYAQKKYAGYANPRRMLRTEPPPERKYGDVSEDDEDASNRKSAQSK